MRELLASRYAHISMLVLTMGVTWWLSFMPASSAPAADQVVSDCGDNGGPNQLRAKLTAAQSSGGGTITFTCGPNVLLNPAAGSLPSITSNITINGGGTITLSGNNAMRILNVSPGGTLTLNNITLTKGYADGDGGAIYNSAGTLNLNSTKFTQNQTTAPWSGGAIFSTGALNISNSEFWLNTAGNGGALMLFHGGAQTTITGSSFHDNNTINTTNGWGGALLLFDGATATMDSSTLYLNLGYNSGGSVFITANSILTMTRDTLYFSVASGLNGGAIANYGSASLTDVTLHDHESSGNGGGIYNNAGTLTLNRVTLDSDKGDGNGGGIYSESGTLTLTNVTFSGDSTIAGEGAGMYINGGTATLTNVTFSGNDSGAGNGGAIYKNGGTVTLKNTLMKHGQYGANCYPSLPSMIGGSFSLSDDFGCGFGPGRDVVPNLNLGPLANNGGFTRTHMPGAGSAAIDNGTGIGCPATDQRGFRRPIGLACDAGSVEVGPLQFLPFIRR